MDVIGEFIELKDQVDSRMLKIEELLQRLKPELDDRTQIDPEQFENGDHLTKDKGEKMKRVNAEETINQSRNTNMKNSNKNSSQFISTRDVMEYFNICRSTMYK